LCPATIGVWYNGINHCYVQKTVNRKGVNSYREIPSLPINGQRIEDIGQFFRKDLKTTINLRTVFKDIRNHIAGNTTGITRDEAIASEIINILLCKIHDEINTAPNEILTFRHGINEDASSVAERIINLFDEKIKNEYSDVFSKHDSISIDAKSLAYIVGELQMYCITEAQRDILGEAFEVFIGPALKGSQGQFFTPRNIVKTTIDIIDPGVDDKIIDPACGSGGFLIVALEAIWDKLGKEATQRGMGKHWLRKREDHVAQNNFRGIEKDFFLSKITKAYMAIVGDGRGGIFCENSLTPEEWNAKTRNEIKNNTFDIVLTNPPFGAKITINDPDILKKYDLGYKWKKDKSNKWIKTSTVLNKQAPQVLFIERCHDLLKPGGKLGIILPDGILGGAKVGYIANWILDKFELVASIDCPLETFSPNTTTKVHLLVLRKRALKNIIDKIFMSVPKVIGHDKKGHTVFLDEDKGIIRDDLADAIKYWHQMKKGKLTNNNMGFTILQSELEGTLNAKRYLPEFMNVLRTIKNSKLRKIKIMDVAERLSTGANVDNLDYVDDATLGKPYILVKNVLDEGISCSNLKYIRFELAKSLIRSTVKEGDIIINRTGDAGIAVVVPSDLAGSIVCGFCFLLRVKKQYNANYIAAFLNSYLGRKQLERLAIGSILEHITKDELKNCQILLPKDDDTIKTIGDHFHSSTEFRVKARKELLEVETIFKRSINKE
jgi:type I restriction enzyme M protein